MFSLNVVVLLVVATAAAATANTLPGWRGEKKIADKEYLMKEKAILQLLSHVHQPLLQPKLIDIAKTWELEDHLDMYKDKEGVTTLLKWWKEGKMLKRGEVFSIFDKEHLKQSIHLFEMLYFAKDWDTMYKSAVWAREHLNEGMFVHVLTLALHHREDSHTLVLPPFYEILPERYISAEIMQKAYEARMKTTDKMDKDIIVITSNFSDWMHKKMSPEKRLAYFTEDVSINENHLDWHLQTPWKHYSGRYNSEPICDQIPYYKYKQLLAKYKLERLSNNLEDLEMFKWEKKMEGYAPHLRYKNGKEMPMRPDGMKIVDTDDVEVEWVKDLERRLKVSIDKELLKDKKDAIATSDIDVGKKTLGCYIDDIISKKEWKADRSLPWSFMNLIGRIADPKKTHDMAPSAMMHFETQRRDPLYYKVIARIEDLMVKEKESMIPYTKDDLLLPGVEIESMDFDKLITYFEPFDVEVSNALDVSSFEDAKKMIVMARLNRLNHMPFTFRMMVKSDKDVTVLIRLFMAPKTDSNGIELTLKEKAPLMFEMDRMITDIKTGKNKIERDSKDMSLFEDDKLSFRNLYKRIEDAIQDKAPFYIQGEKEVAEMASMPKNHMLPKGKKYGMPYTMHVVITPLTTTKDDKPLGFPFDRKVTEAEFKVPNMAEKEILIYHKKTVETHESN